MATQRISINRQAYFDSQNNTLSFNDSKIQNLGESTSSDATVTLAQLNTLTSSIEQTNTNIVNITPESIGAINVSQIAQPMGIASLDADGKVPTSQIPPVAIRDVYQVANESTMIQLQAQVGDIAILSDSHITYVLANNVPSSLASWVRVSTPNDNYPVTSVNGKGSLANPDVIITHTDVQALSENLAESHIHMGYSESKMLKKSGIDTENQVTKMGQFGLIREYLLPTLSVQSLTKDMYIGTENVFINGILTDDYDIGQKITTTTEEYTEIETTASNITNIVANSDKGGNNLFSVSTMIDSVETKALTQVVGTPTQQNFTPYTKAAGKWSNYFGGDGAISIPATSDFAFGTGDYSIEFDTFVTELAQQYQVFLGIEYSSRMWVMLNNGKLTSGYNQWSLADVNVIPINTWVKVKVERVSGTLRLYKNDIVVATKNDPLDLTTPTLPIVIGRSSNATGTNQTHRGYISNLKITKNGIVVLDTCKDGQFKDNSTKNHTLTPSGNVKTTTFSPYNNTSNYVPQNSGSGYFDADGSYLVIPHSNETSIGGSAFTVEADVYCSSISNENIVSKRNGDSGVELWLSVTPSGMSCSFNQSGDINIPCSIYKNSWNSVKLEYNGTNELKAYLNGNLVYTKSNMPTLTYTNTSPLVIGNGQHSTENQYFNGYISNFRMTKNGQESIKVAFDNANIYNTTGVNDIKLVGNVIVNEDDSISFDQNAYIQNAPSNGYYKFMDDFLVSVVVKPNETQPTDDYIMSTKAYGEYGDNTVDWALILSSNNTLTWHKYESVVTIPNCGIIRNEWNTITIQRTSGVKTIKVNGNTVSTTSDADTYQNARLVVGNNGVTDNNGYSGKIKSVSVSIGKGVANEVIKTKEITVLGDYGIKLLDNTLNDNDKITITYIGK